MCRVDKFAFLRRQHEWIDGPIENDPVPTGARTDTHDGRVAEGLRPQWRLQALETERNAKNRPGRGP